jgi:hypothetical protein
MTSSSIHQQASKRPLLAIAVAITFFTSTDGIAQTNAHAPPAAATQQGLLDNLFLLQNTRTARISSWDTTGGNSDFIQIAPGKTATLASIPEAGIIRRFYVAVAPGDRMRFRKVILRMYWDGRKDPSVEVPLGDFFGSGLGTLRPFHSLPINVNPGNRGADFDGLVSYFPMPFEHGARITVENDGGVEGFILYYHVEYEQYAAGQLPANSGRFHAQWRRVPKTPIPEGIHKDPLENFLKDKNVSGNDNYVVLDTRGKGSFVGFFLTVDNLTGGWYGEGDDMIFIDGEKWPPTYPGTGHEEVFDAGCCPDEEFSGPYTGFYLIENLNGEFGGKNQMYRFYLDNPVRFQKAIRVTLEHGHANNYENDYTTTAFWYQKEPHAAFPALPAALDRLPVWPAGVSEAMETELNLNQIHVCRNSAEAQAYMQTPFYNPKHPPVVMSESDAKAVADLSSARNKEFRTLRYQDYIQDVKAAEAIFRGYVKDDVK